MIRVGFGKACITPPLGTLCARGPGAECQAVMDDIFIRSLVLQEDGQTVCLVVADVMGLDRKDIEALRDAIRAATGLSPENILCHCTHTHACPATYANIHDALKPHGLSFYSDDFYAAFLAGAAQAARAALEARRPATVHWGEATVTGIASNRRCGVVRDDNQAIPWIRSSRARPEHRVLPLGDIDPLLRTLVFCGEDRQPFGILLNYACHVTVAGGDLAPYISADFTGEAIRRLETEDGIMALHFTGAGGDINPGKFTGSGNTLSERDADVRRLGGVYFEATRRAIRAATPLSPGTLSWNTRPLFLPLQSNFPARRMLDASLVREVAACKAAATAEDREKAYWSLLWVALKTAVLPQVVGRSLATEIGALRLGDCGIVFLPGECLLAIDRMIRPAAGMPHFMTVAYGDISMGYICPRHVFDEGGYEPSESYLGPAAAGILVEEAINLLRYGNGSVRNGEAGSPASL